MAVGRDFRTRSEMPTDRIGKGSFGMNLENPSQTKSKIRISRQKVEKLGFPFVMLVIYLIMEFARPANPMKIPLVVCVLLFFYWLNLPRKRWNPQIICFLLLLCSIAVMGPFALNTFTIWSDFRLMVVQLLFFGIPLIHILANLRKLSSFVDALIMVFVYVAIYGMLHRGRGPGGHIGDENDLALAMNMAMPFAFVSILSAKNPARKALYAGAFGLLLAGSIATFSRGGFIGLVAVLGYCFALSPKKHLVAIAAVILSAGLWFATPAKYWSEMNTIFGEASNTDPSKGTGALRKEFWQVAIRMFYANPIFGVGLGNFPWNADDYQTHEQKALIGRSYGGVVAHSVYYTVLAELGLSGALIFIALLWFNFKYVRSTITVVKEWKKRVFSRTNRSPNTVDDAVLHDLETARCYAHATMASLLGYLVCGIFLSIFTYPHFWLLTALTVVLKNGTDSLLSEAVQGSEAEPEYRPRVLTRVPAHARTWGTDRLTN
jgi:O-antigen ligase